MKWLSCEITMGDKEHGAGRLQTPWAANRRQPRAILMNNDESGELSINTTAFKHHPSHQLYYELRHVCCLQSKDGSSQTVTTDCKVKK